MVKVVTYGGKILIKHYQLMVFPKGAINLEGGGPGNIYGEEPTKVFKDPKKIIIAAELNENASSFTKIWF